jgi:prepilin-type N-terminal cleavage/methylation domain-containing protein
MINYSASKKEYGFTLIELLVVSAMLAIVLTAMYSLYTSHQRTAYVSDETVEVQQNLRMAMDSISKDIRLAGLLLPTGTGNTPVSLGTAMTITTSSGCVLGVITRITTSPSTVSQAGTSSPNIFTVDNDNSWQAFQQNDYVRIIRPTNRTQPGGTDRVYKVTATPTTNSLTLATVAGYGGDPVGVYFNNGDVICRVSTNASAAPVAPPNTIQYYVANNTVNSSCPVGQQCLIRIDEKGNQNIVAQNISPNGLQFQYLLDGYPLPNETNAPASTDLKSIRAVRVTINGQTASTVFLSQNQAKIRQLESLIQIRNR